MSRYRSGSRERDTPLIFPQVTPPKNKHRQPRAGCGCSSKEEHYMSVKSKVFAAAATLTLVGGVGVAGLATAGAANAATPSCGSGCIDVFSHQFGTFADPSFVMDSFKQGDVAGTPVILFRTSNSDPAEDFTVDEEGLVSRFYALGLVSPQVDLHYLNDYAYEFMYAPYGVQTGLCTGVAATAVNGEHVTLQPC